MQSKKTYRTISAKKLVLIAKFDTNVEIKLQVLVIVIFARWCLHFEGVRAARSWLQNKT